MHAGSGKQSSTRPAMFKHRLKQRLVKKTTQPQPLATPTRMPHPLTQLTPSSTVPGQAQGSQHSSSTRVLPQGAGRSPQQAVAATAVRILVMYEVSRLRRCQWSPT